MFGNKILFVILAFVFSLSAYGGVPQAGNQIGSGGGKNPTSITANLPSTQYGTTHIVLICSDDQTGGVNFYYGCSKVGGTTGHYQVPAAGPTKCYNTTVSTNTTAVTDVLWGYATADFSDGSATDPTGVQVFAKSNDVKYGLVYATGTMDVYQSYPYGPEFPANSWPLFRVNTTDSIIMILDCMEK